MATIRIILAVTMVGLCAGAQAQAGETVDLHRGTPSYQLFVPTAAAPGGGALVVMLHGCNQDATSVATGTNWNALAEGKGFFVLYANQQRGRNGLNCWNWFTPENQKAGSGEPAEIMASVDEVLSHYPIDRRRVYLAGMSAGGAMAAILLSCYPNRFAAGAINSGLPYGIVDGMWDAFTVMGSGPGHRTRRQAACDPQAFHGGVMVVQGLADSVVNPGNAGRVLADFVPSDATQQQTVDVPPAAGSLGYHLTTISSAGRLVAQQLLVEKADHAWVGGAAGVPYCDPRGPNTTAMIWSFFAAVTNEGTAVAAGAWDPKRVVSASGH
jgi:poly(hydroxyalkanoate) depolymerase family esterase